MKTALPKIMIVDDSTTILAAATKFLKTDFDVYTVDDGYKCLAAIMDVRPDLLFLDLSMPRLNGYQALAAIRDNPAFEKLPIIILSGRDSPFDKARARLVGCDAYLQKPFERGVLLETIRRYLPASAFVGE